MAVIAVKHVFSFSSEDKNNPAENLLKDEGTHKWKCAAAGEKTATVVLQLEKACKINGIDLGNAGSAFIEVLVGRSASPSDEFVVLLVASSFMNPPESRNMQNPNRVRFFDSGALHKAHKEGKWDLVKIICSQPFNKTVTYGLSFIKLHGPAGSKSEKATSDISERPPAPSSQISLGKFSLKPEAEDEIKAGSLFATRGKHEEETLTGAAAIRQKAREADTITPLSKLERKPSSEAPSEHKRTSSIAKNHEPSKISKLKKNSTAESYDFEGKNKTKPGGVGDSDKGNPLKRKSTETREASPPVKRKKEKPLNSLLSHVTFAISGIQNPERGELREIALKMGADYRRDWTPRCSHLICAFKDTPKYNQAKGKSRIIKKDWLIQCHKQKKLLPWKKFQLGSSTFDSSTDESDEDEEVVPTSKTSTKREPEIHAAIKTASATATKTPLKHQISNEEEHPVSTKIAEDDPYGASTDEETESGTSYSKLSLPALPDYYSDCVFLLYGELSPTERHSLQRYIRACAGQLEQYMSDKVEYVITRDTWDKNFDSALSENKKLRFIQPEWVYACSDSNKRLPYEKYTISQV